MRWRGRITGVTRNVSIAYDSGGLFATATIATVFTGRFVVDNTNDSLRDTISRAINDHGTRYVWLKKWNDRWHFWGASPLEIATASAATGVIIDSAVVHATGGERPDVTFRGTSYGHTVRRDSMPIFAPGATVTATVYARTSTGADSAWAFLHRRIFRGPGRAQPHPRAVLPREPAGVHRYLDPGLRQHPGFPGGAPRLPGRGPGFDIVRQQLGRVLGPDVDRTLHRQGGQRHHAVTPGRYKHKQHRFPAGIPAGNQFA